MDRFSPIVNLSDIRAFGFHEPKALYVVPEVWVDSKSSMEYIEES